MMRMRFIFLYSIDVVGGANYGLNLNCSVMNQGQTPEMLHGELHPPGEESVSEAPHETADVEAGGSEASEILSGEAPHSTATGDVRGSEAVQLWRVEAPQATATGDVRGSEAVQLWRVEAPQATATGDVAGGVIPAVNRFENRRNSRNSLLIMTRILFNNISVMFISLVGHHFSGRSQYTLFIQPHSTATGDVRGSEAGELSRGEAPHSTATGDGSGSRTRELSRGEPPQATATGDVGGSEAGELLRGEAVHTTATRDVADGVIPAVNRFERNSRTRLRYIAENFPRTLPYNIIDVLVSSLRQHYFDRFVSGVEPGQSSSGSQSTTFSHEREFSPRRSSRQNTATAAVGRSSTNINAVNVSTETEGLTNSNVHRSAISTTGLLSQTQAPSINSVLVQHRTAPSSSNENGQVRASSYTNRSNTSYEDSGGGSLVSYIAPLNARSRHRVITIRRHAPTAEPMYVGMALGSSRISSFRSISNLVLAFGVEVYAMAGFFYNGTSDSCVCFCCGVEWRHWRIGGNPFVEHARCSGGCWFLRQRRCWEFIAFVLELDAGGQPISNQDVLNHRRQGTPDVVHAGAEATTPMPISRDEMFGRVAKLKPGVDNSYTTIEAPSIDVVYGDIDLGRQHVNRDTTTEALSTDVESVYFEDVDRRASRSREVHIGDTSNDVDIHATPRWIDTGATARWVDTGATARWMDTGATARWMDTGATARWMDTGTTAPNVAIAETYSDANISADSSGVGTGDNSVDVGAEVVSIVVNAEASGLAAANEAGTYDVNRDTTTEALSTDVETVYFEDVDRRASRSRDVHIGDISNGVDIPATSHWMATGATARWMDTGATARWMDTGATARWMDTGATARWMDTGATARWMDTGATARWMDTGATAPNVAIAETYSDANISAYSSGVGTGDDSVDVGAEVVSIVVNAEASGLATANEAGTCGCQRVLE